MNAYEANFDGLVGPTHNYAGLSYGNVASSNNRSLTSNPKLAALQGLEKMKTMRNLGLVQGVLPPHERPAVNELRALGFSGSDADILTKAAKQAPKLLASCCSAATMWTANAATVSPSLDTADGKVHLTPANLSNKFHRAMEHKTTRQVLQAVFNSERYFTHHEALPGIPQFGDEGAANYTRFCTDYHRPGVAFFVYGDNGFSSNERRPRPQRYPARQTREASEAIARQHQLACDRIVFAQQHPNVIDQGVFHNDVIAVGNKNLLFCHEHAFLHQRQVYEQLREAHTDSALSIVEVSDDQVSVSDAVSSYLFNSQLVTVNGKNTLIVPSECDANEKVARYLRWLTESHHTIDAVRSFDLRQSMKNGGGPACLRLRVVLTDAELAAVNPGSIMSDSLYQRLVQWVNDHYRDRLTEKDLADPQLLMESRNALDELTAIMQLGSVYDFQR
ncbi:N-succinylarginine dihydrolase [Candidatus Sororendozoicomonas aggregata]|uniref:N-succinylarginine dihydrolase n=1 Tax=Candidatus Sororendozoicomonas aggregata TaxID=3073239 RepID=UPI002ED174D2